MTREGSSWNSNNKLLYLYRAALGDEADGGEGKASQWSALGGDSSAGRRFVSSLASIANVINASERFNETTNTEEM